MGSSCSQPTGLPTTAHNNPPQRQSKADSNPAWNPVTEAVIGLRRRKDSMSHLNSQKEFSLSLNTDAGSKPNESHLRERELVAATRHGACNALNPRITGKEPRSDTTNHSRSAVLSLNGDSFRNGSNTCPTFPRIDGVDSTHRNSTSHSCSSSRLQSIGLCSFAPNGPTSNNSNPSGGAIGLVKIIALDTASASSSPRCRQQQGRQAHEYPPVVANKGGGVESYHMLPIPSRPPNEQNDTDIVLYSFPDSGVLCGDAAPWTAVDTSGAGSLPQLAQFVHPQTDITLPSVPSQLEDLTLSNHHL